MGDADMWNTLWNTLIEPFSFPFLQRAFLCAFLVGGLCGLVGAYVVLRRISYIGHGLSYAIFGGAVVSHVLKINFYLGSTTWGFLSALLIIWSGRQHRIGADAAIGIITTASFAVGVILLSAVHDARTNFDAALFGNILSVRTADMYVVLGVAIVIGLIIFCFYKQLLFTTFDPEVAAIYGVKTRRIDALFSFILAALLIAAMQIVGVTLIAASLITPPTVARLLTNSFHRLLLLSTAIGAAGGVVGVYASWYLNWATGATIVVTHATLFVLVFLYSSSRISRLRSTALQSQSLSHTSTGQS
jgi:ABC-type Mn2+/Zn2+ transport system permease subunit